MTTTRITPTNGIKATKKYDGIKPQYLLSNSELVPFRGKKYTEACQQNKIMASFGEIEKMVQISDKQPCHFYMGIP